VPEAVNVVERLVDEVLNAGRSKAAC
jgi:hypothetical protein